MWRQQKEEAGKRRFGGWGGGGRLGVLVKIPRDSQFVNTFGQIFGASLIGFCHKTAEIHSLCIS